MNKTMLGTVIGAFQLVGMKRTNDGQFVGFILNEVFTDEKKKPRKYFTESLLDVNSNQMITGNTKVKPNNSERLRSIT